MNLADFRIHTYKILIVEDDEEDAFLLQETIAQIQDIRYELTQYNSLTDGLEALKNQSFDVILLDLGLPECTGLDTVERIVDANVSPAIVVMTGLNDNESAQKALEMGMDDYLIKGSLDSTILSRAIRYAVQRKKNRLELQRSLKEKEVLLAEVHHRVKNNMQIISSLLKMEVHSVENEEALSCLQDSRNRIKSMSLIHDKLYQSQDFTHIEIESYINDLTIYFYRAYLIDPKRVKFKIDIHNIDLDINNAIPLGLIINELLSNSLKYAFPKNQKGNIRIDITETEPHNYSMVFSDDGIGLPAEFEIEKTTSLGLHLVQSLTAQLHGSLQVYREKGTRFELKFTDKISKG
jgi:two-component sensor histidine kinase/CheY-like chemotaxis protein